jgi:polysaccharide export outer membrane protein
MVSLAMIGDVYVVGKTTDQLRTMLTTLYSAYIKSPQVSVVLQESRSRRFAILGEVVRPGTYSLTRPMTVLEALALSGGFRDFAKKNKMFILRENPDGSRSRIPIRYTDIIGADDPNVNPLIQVHDTLIVP